LSKRNKSDWSVTAKGTERYLVEKRWYGPADGGSIPSDRSVYLGYAKGVTGAYCRIDAFPDNEALISLASVGVTNPLLILWEKTPFSFVVDWAFPVGEWLESLDALLGFQSAYTSTSTFSVKEWKTSGSSWHGTDGSYVSSQLAGSRRIVNLVRSAQAGVPLSRFPRIKDPRSFGHMANGLALLAQAFGRKR